MSSASSSSYAVGPSSLCSKLELTLSCSNLPSLDLVSKSDPCVVFYLQDARGSWRECGRTECIHNESNPLFTRRQLIDYFFEQTQRFRFEVYDFDSDSPDLQRHDFIGQVETTVANIVTRPGRKLKAPLVDRSGSALKSATITILAEELRGSNEFVTLQITASDLDKVGIFSSTDAYLSFHKRNTDGSVGPQVWKTEAVKNSVHPSWREFQISLQTLCNADHHRQLIVRCLHQQHSHGGDEADDKVLGEFTTTVAELAVDHIGPGGQLVSGAQTGKRQFTLTKPNHPTAEKRTKSHGHISFRKVFLRAEPTFLDYIRGGLQMNLMIAVDFTASNGHPRDKGSLHFRADPHHLNRYQQAIQSISEILLPYDSDGRIVAWGFGAQLILNQPTSNCFNLNFNPANPEVEGLAGMMNAYLHAVDRVTFSGPTLFAPLLVEATRAAIARPYSQSFQNYSLLLIITDGVINDMDETIATIVQASDKPLSIIIVGVGNADFSAMQVLDADESRLSAFGETQKRDTVQFVKFSDFENRSLADLAAHTLAELPTQVINFMKLHNIPPLPPLSAQPSMNSLQPASIPSSSTAYGAPPPAYAEASAPDRKSVV